MQFSYTSVCNDFNVKINKYGIVSKIVVALKNKHTYVSVDQNESLYIIEKIVYTGNDVCPSQSELKLVYESINFYLWFF